MKNIIFDYKDSCTVPAEQLTHTTDQLIEEIKRITDSQSNGYDTDYASVNLLHDASLLNTVAKLAKEKKSLNPTLLLVIGIGGSNLATAAIIEALHGKFYNDNSDIDLYFADTVDTDYLNTIMQRAEKELCSGNNILLNVISKSGTTTETIANFQLLLELLKKHRPYNYNNFIVITTDHNSALWHYADKEEIATLAIPEKVGGRYSAFSAVGLFPLAMCNINIEELHAGAQSALIPCLATNTIENMAAISATILFLLYKKGYVIHDTFLFSVELESLGKWYRQLMAESIGKSHNTQGKLINNGITPTVSIGSTDLHSVAQLYLSGPYNTVTTFVSVNKNNTDFYLEKKASLDTLAPTLGNTSITNIMNAILNGTMNAYKLNNRPFISMHIPQKSAYYIGQWMQTKMFEIMYLGYLMNINPFDQPNVELYKSETKKLLSRF